MAGESGKGGSDRKYDSMADFPSGHAFAVDSILDDAKAACDRCDRGVLFSSIMASPARVINASRLAAGVGGALIFGPVGRWEDVGLC